MAVRIQLRRDTASNWSTNNPVLRPGEVGVETDTLKFKIGPSVTAPAIGTAWNSITAYANITPTGLSNSLGNYILSADQGTSGGPAELDSNGDLIVPENSVILWNDDAYTYSTTLTATEPTADRTITFPNATGTVALTSQLPTQYFTDELAQDAAAAALAAGTHTNITVTYSDEANSISLAAAPGYVDEQAVDAVAAALAAGTHTNITVGYNDNANSISLTGAVTYTDENAQDAVGNAVGTGLSYNDSTGAISVDTSTIQARVTNVTDTEIGYLDGVTSAIQTQIDAKAPIASPTFTGTVGGITKSMVGLDNVDNTTDANKPVSTATQTALNLKAPLASPSFTGGIYVTGNTTLEGDLTVTGTTTTVNTINTAIADNMIYLNEGIHYDISSASGNGTNQTYTTVLAHDITAGMFIRVTGITPSGYNLASFVEVLSVGNKTITVAGTFTGTYTSGGELTSKGSTNPDLGFAGGYNDGTYHHAGLFRDASDGSWKFFQGYDPEPDGLFINTADASFALAPLKVAGFEATSATIGDVSNTELQYVNGVTSAIQTQIDAKQATIIPGTGLSVSGANVTINNAALSDYLLDGVSGSSYGLIGTSTYLDVKNTNGYNKEIELDIAAVKTQLNTDGYLTTSSTSTLTNKTLTSPKINEDVALTATATELNYVDGVTSAIQTQLDAKVDESIITAKGDLYVGSASATLDNLAVGSNGYLLTADSAEPLGVKWAAAPVSLPDQTGNNGEYLTTDGTTASWAAIPVTSAATTSARGTVYGSTGAYQTILGYEALGGGTFSGSFSTVVMGYQAGYNLGAGEKNVIVGGFAGTANSSGSYNTILGTESAKNTSGGSNNVLLGYQSGYDLSNGSNNILIGSGAQASTSTTSNEVSLGNSSITRFKVPGVGLDIGKTYTLSSNSATTIDETEFGTWSSIEYLVSLKQGSKVRTSKVILQTDTTDVDMTEYGITETGGTMSGVSITAALGGIGTAGALKLTVTDAATTNVTVKLSKVVL
jgi:hypothetical protein